jgi:hypothetical protein
VTQPTPPPLRTFQSKSYFLRETAAVVANSLPILAPQALLAAALVYVEQGRAFLLLESSVVLLYLMAVGSAVITVVFSRLVARRVDPDPSANPACTDRQRWLALQCGSGIAGLVSGFLPAGVIEAYISSKGCELPSHTLESYRGSAALATLLVATLLIGYLVWRISNRKSDGTSIRDTGLLIAVLLAAPISFKVWPSHHFLMFGALLIAASVLLTMTVLQGPAPIKRRGGILEWWWAKLLVILCVVAGVLVAIFPGGLPSGASLWFILQCWTALAVLLTVSLRWLWRSHLGWFFLSLGLLACAAIAFSGRAFQAREIRTLAEKRAARPLLIDFARQWLQRRMDQPDAARPYPIVVVSAAGGGIRAAYWTANLLAAFQDRQPAFAAHVFAISGVSGGSVGAAVFDALIQAKCSSCSTAAHRILKGDFLAPALSTLLTRDIVSTTLPIRLPDRGITLEQAFERAWQDTMHTPALAEPFDNLWQGEDMYRVPALFLNATEAGSAERAVFSNVSVIPESGAAASIQRVAEGLSLRLSTAMLLSARFPYISPEGQAGTGDSSLRFVDGGYFDNSGAATLTQVIDALNGAASDLKAAGRFRVAALVIQNEPVPASHCSPSRELGGVSTPIAILDELRARRAETFTNQLRKQVTAENGNLLLDSFRPESGAAEFPLGWTLANATVEDMDAQIRTRMKQGDSPIVQLLQSLKN